MNELDRTKELETKGIGALLLAYALPSVVSQVIASIYNIADRIFIGQGVDAMAIAGLAITLPVMNIIHAFGSLVGAGSAARMSIVLGKKDINWAENILGNSLLLTFFFGALFLSFGYGFLDSILGLFGASAQTLEYARTYMLIVLPGMFLTTLTFNLTGLMRATGYPVKSMFILVGGAVLNMILDPIFIFVCHWGIAGAAWATTISMASTAVAAVIHFCKKSSFIRFRRHAWKPRFYIFKNILLIGISPFSMNVAASAVVAMLNSQLLRYGAELSGVYGEHAGDLAVGTYGVCNTFCSFIVMFIIGICQGMQPIAGYNYGAGHSDRLKGVLILATKVNVLVGSVGAFLGLVFPTALASMFTRDVNMLQMCTPAMRYMLVMFPLIGFTITNSHFFQSIDKPWVAITTSLSRQVLFLLPMIYIIPPIVAALGGQGLTGIWISVVISDIMGALLAAILLYSQRYVLKNNVTLRTENN